MKKTVLVLTAFILLRLVAESQPQTKHKIGESFGGGIIFLVTAHGKHGLIAETQDQSKDCLWLKTNDVIKDSIYHSEAGKAFTDWRLPTQDELNELYNKKIIVGGFTDNYYWSSSVKDDLSAWSQRFSDGGQADVIKGMPCYVRAIRAF